MVAKNRSSVRFAAKSGTGAVFLAGLLTDKSLLKKTEIRKPLAEILLIETLLFGIGPVLAASEQKELLVYAPTMESTTTNELAQYGSKLTVITDKQIELAGVNADITRVLQMFVPGLYVSPKAGPFDYGHYSLLGGKNDDTLILIDGVRLNNRLYGGIYIDTLSVTAIERIEILKGPQSLMFGTQAIAGVINIVTKIPQNKKLSGKVNLAIDSFAGSDTAASAGNVYDNTLGNFSWLVWADKNRSSGYKPFRDRDLDDSVTQRKRSYDLNVAGVKASQTFAGSARLTLLWQYAQGKFDFASAGAGSYKKRNDRKQNIGTLNFEHYVTDNVSYFIKGHINRWDTLYLDIRNSEKDGVKILKVVSDYDYWGFRDYGLQLEGKLNFANDNELVFGMDNQWFSGQDQVLKIKKNTATASSFYLQLRPRFNLLSDWYPALGVRNEKIRAGSEVTVWMVSSRYDLTPELQLRGQIGTSYKLPTAERLYAIEEDDIGNPALKPEQSRNFEAGFDYIPELFNGNLKLSASYYNRHIYDMQTKNTERFWINVPGEVAIQGFETEGSYKINDQWALSADLTRNYLNHRYVINNVPYLFARGRLDYSAPGQRWGGQLAVRYIDRVISRNIDYGHYVVFDASAWLHLDQADRHKLSLNIDNLLNREYASQLATNGRKQVIDTLGRPVTAELRYSWTF